MRLKAAELSQDIKNNIGLEFFKKSAETISNKLVESWRFSQPPHLRHLSIARDALQTEGSRQLNYRTFGNFESAIKQEETSWEAAGGPIKYKPLNLDEWGFPALVKKRFAKAGRDIRKPLESDALISNTPAASKQQVSDAQQSSPSLKRQRSDLAGGLPARKRGRPRKQVAKNNRVQAHNQVQAISSKADESPQTAASNNMEQTQAGFETQSSNTKPRKRKRSLSQESPWARYTSNPTNGSEVSGRETRRSLQRLMRTNTNDSNPENASDQLHAPKSPRQSQSSHTNRDQNYIEPPEYLQQRPFDTPSQELSLHSNRHISFKSPLTPVSNDSPLQMPQTKPLTNFYQCPSQTTSSQLSYPSFSQNDALSSSMMSHDSPQLTSHSLDYTEESSEPIIQLSKGLYINPAFRSVGRRPGRPRKNSILAVFKLPKLKDLAWFADDSSPPKHSPSDTNIPQVDLTSDLHNERRRTRGRQDDSQNPSQSHDECETHHHRSGSHDHRSTDKLVSAPQHAEQTTPNSENQTNCLPSLLDSPSRQMSGERDLSRPLEPAISGTKTVSISSSISKPGVVEAHNMSNSHYPKVARRIYSPMHQVTAHTMHCIRKEPDELHHEDVEPPGVLMGEESVEAGDTQPGESDQSSDHQDVSRHAVANESAVPIAGCSRGVSTQSFDRDVNREAPPPRPNSTSVQITATSAASRENSRVWNSTDVMMREDQIQPEEREAGPPLPRSNENIDSENSGNIQAFVEADDYSGEREAHCRPTKIVLNILNRAGGVYPAGKEIWCAYTTQLRRKNSTNIDEPDRDTVMRIMQTLVEKGEMRLLPVQLRKPNGTIISTKLAIKTEISNENARVDRIKQQIVRKDPRPYFPEGVEIDAKFKGPTVRSDNKRSTPAERMRWRGRHNPRWHQVLQTEYRGVTKSALAANYIREPAWRRWCRENLLQQELECLERHEQASMNQEEASMRSSFQLSLDPCSAKQAADKESQTSLSQQLQFFLNNVTARGPEFNEVQLQSRKRARDGSYRGRVLPPTTPEGQNNAASLASRRANKAQWKLILESHSLTDPKRVFHPTTGTFGTLYTVNSNPTRSKLTIDTTAPGRFETSMPADLESILNEVDSIPDDVSLNTSFKLPHTVFSQIDQVAKWERDNESLLTQGKELAQPRFIIHVGPDRLEPRFDEALITEMGRITNLISSEGLSQKAFVDRFPELAAASEAIYDRVRKSQKRKIHSDGNSEILESRRTGSTEAMGPNNGQKTSRVRKYRRINPPTAGPPVRRRVPIGHDVLPESRSTNVAASIVRRPFDQFDSEEDYEFGIEDELLLNALTEHGTNSVRRDSTFLRRRNVRSGPRGWSKLPFHEDQVDRFIAIVTAVRFFSYGGFDDIDWRVVQKFLSIDLLGMSAEGAWKRIRQSRRQKIDALEEELPDVYIEALEREEIGAVNTNSLPATDWEPIIQLCLSIPGWRSGIAPQKPPREPSPSPIPISSPVPASISTERNTGLENIKTYIRATLLTPAYRLTPAEASARLKKFSDIEVSNALHDLRTSNAIVPARWGTKAIRGHSFRIAASMNQIIRTSPLRPTSDRFQQAIRFKQAWDDELTTQTATGKPLQDIRLTVPDVDPDRWVLYELQAVGHVAMKLELPDITSELPSELSHDARTTKDAGDRQLLSQFGIKMQNRRNSKASASELDFPISVAPTGQYEVGLPPLGWSWDAPRLEGERPPDRYPIWIDLSGEVLEEVWALMVVSCVCFLHAKVGATLERLVNEFGAHGLVQEWEVEWVLNWLAERGVVKFEDGRWEVGRWWWCLFGAEGWELSGKGLEFATA